MEAPSGTPDEAPLVLVEAVRGARRLSAVDAAAAARGLVPGLTLADARARVPGVIAAPSDPAADARFLLHLGGLAEVFTPSVALDPPDGLVLDVTGCAHLVGGEVSLHAAVLRRFAAGGVSVRGSLAGTPDAARILARHGRVAIVPPGGEAAALRPLPVLALGLETEATVALGRAGLKTIGDLADRPSVLLSARFGEEVGLRLRRAMGLEDARIVPLRPLPPLRVDRRFAEPASHPDGLQAALAELVAEACQQMEARGVGGRCFQAAYFRGDGAVRRVAIECGQPNRAPAAIMRLFRERLDSLADPLDPGFGFDALRLSVPVLEPYGARQATLDGRSQGEAEVAALIDRLSTRLGRDRVLRVEPRDTHDPDREMRFVPALDAPPRLGAWPMPEPGAAPMRPLHLFVPPQPIEAVAEIPDGPPARFRWRRVWHEVTLAEGPERIAPEWWRRGGERELRDYYRIEDTDGRRYWVFRRGHYGSDARWFLHGRFA